MSILNVWKKTVFINDVTIQVDIFNVNVTVASANGDMNNTGFNI